MCVMDPHQANGTKQDLFTFPVVLFVTATYELHVGSIPVR